MRSNKRPVAPEDLYEWNTIWHYDPSTDQFFCNIVKEVLNPNDNYKAYIAEDECRYGLEDAYVIDEYGSLKNEFDNALEQASKGKGKERHAKKDENFEDQVMCAVQRLLIDHPVGGLAYQVIKKTIESGRLLNERGVDSAKNEIYGAMNYLGGVSIIYEEQREKDLEKKSEN